MLLKMPLMLLGSVSSSQLPGLIVYFFPIAVLGVHWSSTLNEVSWLQYKNADYQVSLLAKWVPMVSRKREMISDVISLELSREKGCPLSAGDWGQGIRTHWGSRLPRVHPYLWHVSCDTAHWRTLPNFQVI